MKLPYSEYEKFYFALYDCFKSRAFKGKLPPKSNSGKRSPDIWWKTKVQIGDKEISAVRYYFGVGGKFFYNLYLEESVCDIDNVAYFRALLYLGIGCEDFPELDFLKLISLQRKQYEEKNSTQIDIIESDDEHEEGEDVFESVYTYDKLCVLRQLFKEKYSLAEYKTIDKLRNQTLSQIDHNDLEQLSDQLTEVDIFVLFKYVFDRFNPRYRRIDYLNFIIHKIYLTDNQILSLLETSEFQEYIFSNLGRMILPNYSLDKLIPIETPLTRNFKLIFGGAISIAQRSHNPFDRFWPLARTIILALPNESSLPFIKGIIQKCCPVIFDEKDILERTMLKVHMLTSYHSLLSPSRGCDWRFMKLDAFKEFLEYCYNDATRLTRESQSLKGSIIDFLSHLKHRDGFIYKDIANHMFSYALKKVK